jgi:hypothetical protein
VCTLLNGQLEARRRLFARVLRYSHRRFSPAWESVSIITHAAPLLTQLSSLALLVLLQDM